MSRRMIGVLAHLSRGEDCTEYESAVIKAAIRTMPGSAIATRLRSRWTSEAAEVDAEDEETRQYMIEHGMHPTA